MKILVCLTGNICIRSWLMNWEYRTVVSLVYMIVQIVIIIGYLYCRGYGDWYLLGYILLLCGIYIVLMRKYFQLAVFLPRKAFACGDVLTGRVKGGCEACNYCAVRRMIIYVWCCSLFENRFITDYSNSYRCNHSRIEIRSQDTVIICSECLNFKTISLCA